MDSDNFIASSWRRLRRYSAYAHVPRQTFGIRSLQELLLSFTPFERALLYACTLVLGVSTFAMAAMVSESATSVVPARGGELTEGIVGTPRFVNPLLAASDADRDLTMLVYSGLMRARPDNTLVPDLADHYDISDDHLTYTFTIREDATFHDGTPVSAHDVVYTVATAQNPLYKSVRRVDWDGVVAQEIDTRTVRFTLPRPYAPFLEAATIGILPSHLWENIKPDDFPFDRLNVSPIGSGPYEVKSVDEDSHGTPLAYTLRAFSSFTLGEPYIPKMTITIFGNDTEALESLKKGSVETFAGVSPDAAGDMLEQNFITRALPRTFALFFNETKNAVLADASVRKALSEAVSRSAIVETALHGYAVPVDSPIPPGIYTTREQAPYVDTQSATERVNEAASLLDASGWTLDPDTTMRSKKKEGLSFTIATADTPELTKTADMLAQAYRAVGAHVAVKIFSSSDLNTNVIRPRDYDALLFGEVVGRSADVYAFWHSSQRNDPGLNLALYANAKTDKLLADARKEIDPELREADLARFEETIKNDRPAVFLYAPMFLYATPRDLYGVSLGSLTSASERFLNVYEWHRETERVWNIFLQ